MRCVAFRHDATLHMCGRLVTERNATHEKRIRVDCETDRLISTPLPLSAGQQGRLTFLVVGLLELLGGGLADGLQLLLPPPLLQLEPGLLRFVPEVDRCRAGQVRSDRGRLGKLGQYWVSHTRRSIWSGRIGWVVPRQSMPGHRLPLYCIYMYLFNHQQCLPHLQVK